MLQPCLGQWSFHPVRATQKLVAAQGKGTGMCQTCQRWARLTIKHVSSSGYLSVLPSLWPSLGLSQGLATPSQEAFPQHPH